MAAAPRWAALAHDDRGGRGESGCVPLHNAANGEAGRRVWLPVKADELAAGAESSAVPVDPPKNEPVAFTNLRRADPDRARLAGDGLGGAHKGSAVEAAMACLPGDKDQDGTRPPSLAVIRTRHARETTSDKPNLYQPRLCRERRGRPRRSGPAPQATASPTSRRLRRVPAARAVHHVPRRTHDRRGSARAAPGRCPAAAAGPGLPGHPPEGGRRAGASDAPQTRRPTSPDARTRQDRRRLQPACRGTQPRTHCVAQGSEQRRGPVNGLAQPRLAATQPPRSATRRAALRGGRHHTGRFTPVTLTGSVIPPAPTRQRAQPRSPGPRAWTNPDGGVRQSSKSPRSRTIPHGCLHGRS